MRTHPPMGLCYKDKIEAVKTHICGQTCRRHPVEANRQRRPGDHIILHTWAERPYRSNWDWREEFVLTSVPQIIISREGVWQLPGDPVVPSAAEDHEHMRLLSKAELDLLATLDCINPPTGEEFIKVITSINTKNVIGEIIDVLRFEVLTRDGDERKKD